MARLPVTQILFSITLILLTRQASAAPTSRQNTVPEDTCTSSQLDGITEHVNLQATYVWGHNQTDLDTSTRFLGENVGHGCSGAPLTYMHFQGDRTGAGDQETTTIEVGRAYTEGAWSGTTSVVFKAQWYGSDANEGPARLLLRVVVLRKPIGSTMVVNIDPGVGRGCSSTWVAMATVDEDGKISLAKAQNCA